MEPSPLPRPPWHRRPAAWVFFGALLLRLAVLSRFSGTAHFLQQTGDSKFYEDWALRILGGEWTDGQAFYGLPGYAFLLAAIYKIVGADQALRIFGVGFLQAAVEALTSILIFKIASAACISESKRPISERGTVIAGAIAALAWATFLPAQTFSAILMPTCWLVGVYWFCVWQAMQPQERTPWYPWPVLGLLIGAMAMMVATVLFALPLLLARIGLSVGRSLRWPARAVRAAMAAVLLVGAVFAGTAPAWIHNYFIAKDPVLLSAHSGLNFWMGNSPGANGYPKIPTGLRPSQEGLLKDSITWAERAAGHPLKRSEVSRYWSAQADRYISEYPEAWVRLLGVKFRNFWNAFEYDDLSVMALLGERGVLWPGLRWGWVAALGLTGLGLALIRGGPARWVAAAVLLHMCAIMPVFVTERYRLAAAPGLIVLGVYAVRELRRAQEASRWKTATALSAGSLGAALFVSWPLHDPALWSLAPLNLGVKELAVAERLLDSAKTEEDRAGGMAELGRAEKHLAAAYALAPGDPGIVFALGNLWFDKGDPARAEAFYRRTLQLNPHHASAMNNLGYLAVEAKQWDTAAGLLEEAVRIEPDNAKTFYLLARAREGLGDLDGARQAVAEALRLEPRRREFMELSVRLRER